MRASAARRQKSQRGPKARTKARAARRQESERVPKARDRERSNARFATHFVFGSLEIRRFVLPATRVRHETCLRLALSIGHFTSQGLLPQREKSVLETTWRRKGYGPKAHKACPWEMAWFAETLKLKVALSSSASKFFWFSEAWCQSHPLTLLARSIPLPQFCFDRGRSKSWQGLAWTKNALWRHFWSIRGLAMICCGRNKRKIMVGV